MVRLNQGKRLNRGPARYQPHARTRAPPKPPQVSAEGGASCHHEIGRAPVPACDHTECRLAASDAGDMLRGRGFLVAEESTHALQAAFDAVVANDDTALRAALDERPELLRILFNTNEFGRRSPRLWARVEHLEQPYVCVLHSHVSLLGLALWYGHYINLLHFADGVGALLIDGHSLHSVAHAVTDGCGGVGDLQFIEDCASWPLDELDTNRLRGLRAWVATRVGASTARDARSHARERRRLHTAWGPPPGARAAGVLQGPSRIHGRLRAVCREPRRISADCTRSHYSFMPTHGPHTRCRRARHGYAL